MNSLSTFTIILVIGAVGIANVAGLPGKDGYYGNSVGGGIPSASYCGRSEVFSRCGANPLCQKTCDNYKEPIACTRSGIVANVCVPGCVCKEGFVRVVTGDECIPVGKCEGRVKH